MEYIYLHKKLSFCFIAKKYIFVTSAEQFPKRVEQLSRSPEYLDHFVNKTVCFVTFLVNH